mmetsp:Transcript_58499/g.143096  ORF Transcript_58499/g.143096 Transcript_58499/m.143096 type:complete len:682 (+) Transcript_58499:117-2162(+)
MVMMRGLAAVATAAVLPFVGVLLGPQVQHVEAFVFLVVPPSVLSSQQQKEGCCRRKTMDGDRSDLPISDATKLSLSTSPRNGKVAATSTIEEGDNDTQPQFIDWTKYWYPIMPLANLDEYDENNDIDSQGPVPITILDQPLVIWKSSSSSSSSSYSVFADICPHRRAPLSSGKLINHQNENSSTDNDSKTLACRYHGWEFDSKGSCTNIPMMKQASSNSKSKNQSQSKRRLSLSKAFCATSYPTKEHDGLLWVYMNPTESNPPPLGAELFQNNSGDESSTSTTTTSWSLNVAPVSFMSMIENSFDPSHAPFAHETVDLRKRKNKTVFTFSSKNAIPIDKYEVVVNNSNELNSSDDHPRKDPTQTRKNDGPSRDGFVVRHTPYQRQAGPSRDPSASSQTSTWTERTFVAPYTTIAKLPFGTTTLHFVPSTAGSTLIYVGGRVFDGPSNKKKSIISKLIPSKIQSIAKDFRHFWSTSMSIGSYRFYNQDIQLMQGQDYRKMITRSKMATHKNNGENHFWDDMFPTTSDVGVKTFQKWMKRYGGYPTFVMPSSSSSSLSLLPPTFLSAWDRHAKYCPQCKNTIRRLSKVSMLSRRVSRWSLRGSVVGSALLLLSSLCGTVTKCNGSKAVIMLMMRNIAIPSSIVFLSIFATSQYIHQLCSDILEKVFATPTTVPEYQLMQIYSK